MCQSRRYPQHTIVFPGEANCFPSPEGRRIAAQVHRDIQNFSDYNAYQFPLRTLYLVMHPTHHVVRGERVIILNKMFIDAHFAHDAFVVALEEVTALVAKDSWLKN